MGNCKTKRRRRGKKKKKRVKNIKDRQTKQTTIVSNCKCEQAWGMQYVCESILPINKRHNSNIGALRAKKKLIIIVII